MEIEKLEKAVDMMESIFVVLLEATVLSYTLGGMLYMIFPRCPPPIWIFLFAVIAITTSILLAAIPIAMSEIQDMIARRLRAEREAQLE